MSSLALVTSFSIYQMVLGIAISVAGISLVCSCLVAWFFLVLGTLCTVGWLKRFLPSQSLLLYFLVSVQGSLVFLMSCWFGVTLAFVISLFVLLGLPPFQFWVFKVLCNLDIISCVLFLGPMKSGYFLLLLSSSVQAWVLTFLPFCVGITLLFSTTSLCFVVFGSSCCSYLYLLLLSPTLGFFYWSIYLVALSSLVLFSYSKISLFISICCLIGIPPLGMFWAKIILLLQLPAYVSLFLLVTSSLTLFPYLSMCLSSISNASTSFLSLVLQFVLPCFICLLLGLW